MHRTAPHNRELSDPKGQQAKVEKPWDRAERITFVQFSYNNIVGKGPMGTLNYKHIRATFTWKPSELTMQVAT